MLWIMAYLGNFNSVSALNPRRAGSVWTPLLSFSQMSKKRRDLGFSRSGHQVTSSDLTSEKLRMFVISTQNAQSPCNCKQLISVPVSMKCISRNFDIHDPRSGQFCDLSIISQWGKNERRLFWKKIIRNTLKHRVTGRLDTLSRNIETSDPSPCRQGHFRSWKVTSSFSAITFDRDHQAPRAMQTP